MPKGVYDHKKKSLVDRFWPKVNIGPDCWGWTGYIAPNGYGRIGAGGREPESGPVILYAHRASWMIHNGDIQDGMTVDHKCFNTKCVNPDHLQLLSNPENARRQRRWGC